LAVGVDVGGTKIAAGLVGADGSMIQRLRRDTPATDANAITELIADVVGQLSPRQRGTVVPVGVGAAGVIDGNGVVRFAPNIDWADFPLRDELRARIDAPVTVDNDANVAAWGEYRVGAGAGVDCMVMLTVGTGVGGGVVLDDRLMRGCYGMAAELGHLIVDEGGQFLCGCGNHGCLETVASGTAIGRFASRGLENGSAPRDTVLHDLEPADVTGKSVTVAAHAGDAYAREVLDCVGTWLGVGIASITNAFDPALVVVGGGAMQAGELLLRPARAAAEARLLGRGHRRLPPVVRAQLTDDAGLVGAALLAMTGEPA
jgi:glucokinase